MAKKHSHGEADAASLDHHTVARHDGATHPPPPSHKPLSAAQLEVRRASTWMRGEMVRELVRRMRRRSRGTHGLRMRKRNTALALSAGIMAVSTGAVDLGRPAPGYMNSSENVDPMSIRVDSHVLSASEAMKEALAEEEGVRLTVYRDVAGYPTVGVGHLVRPADRLKVGDRISYERALAFLEEDLKHAENAVRRLVGDLPLLQNEFDALVDLVYNVGEGNVSALESPMLNQAISSRDYAGIAEELAYHYAGGSKAKGLVYRSERRQAIFRDAAYHDPRPVSISVSARAST